VLVELRHSRIRADEATVRESLQGDWRQEHLFTLRQSRQAYRQQIEDCHREIAQLLEQFESPVDLAEKPLPTPSGPSRKRRSGRGLKSKFETGDGFASWVGLCTDHDKTGGRVDCKGVRKIKTALDRCFVGRRRPCITVAHTGDRQRGSPPPLARQLGYELTPAQLTA